jgi:uncharacterized protein
MELLLISLLTLVAAGVGTITGFGISTIMIPVLVIFFSPAEAIFLVAIIHWFDNIWKITLFRSGINTRLVLLFGIVGLFTSYVGAYLSVEANQELLLRMLGFFLSTYAVYLIVDHGFKIKAGNTTALVGGALSGFFAGTFGIGGPIRSAFLAAFDLPKAVYIATAGAIGLMVDITRIIAYLTAGATLPKLLTYGLLMFVPASFVGALIGRRLVNKIPQHHFRTVVAAFLLVVSVKLILFP